MSYAAALEATGRQAGLRRSERTRLAILAATARLLGRMSPAALTISAVAAEAGVAHGTVYLHARDGRALLEATAEGFAHFIRDHLAAVRDGAAGEPVRVLATTRRYVALFRENSGLMRCLTQAGESGAAESGAAESEAAESEAGEKGAGETSAGGFRATFHALNRDWNGRAAHAIQRRRRAAGRSDDPDDALQTAYALGGMVDEFLAQLYLRRDPALAAVASDEEAVARLLTRLWLAGADADADAYPMARE
ncbi:MAG: TetR/AcrR family transcriptional regulator [Alphaproteobacteria bacterium]|nr:TetR/AcrR family transcriptional regulator [Alphaproteobacteria bacterium]